MTAPVLDTKLSPDSEGFRANAAHNRALFDRLRADVARTALGGNEKSRERHTSRGKLLPRDRVERLLDPGSPFLEIGQLAANGLYDDEVPGAGMIAGIGRVSGRQCMVVCNDATVKGGTYYPLTVKKHLRAQEIAQENRLPCIYLVDSGGANLPHQAEVFPDRDHFGRIFFNQANDVRARHSADRVRDGQLHRRRRLCSGDERRDDHRARPGDDLPRRPAAGQSRDRRGHFSAEELGGADTHGRKSGVVDHVAENDEHALTIVRDIVSTLAPPPTPDVPNIALADPRPPRNIRRRRPLRHRAERRARAL